MKHDYLLAAQSAAIAGGRILLDMFGKLEDTDIEHKGTIDLVTAADRAAEREILAILQGRFPNHGFWAEESGKRAGSEYVWVIDPLDGTTNYAHGFPWFSVSVALMRAAEVVAGVVYHCTRDEIFAAEAGSGALCNGRKIVVSRTDKLINGLFCTGFSYDVATAERDNLKQVGSVLKKSRGVRRTGSAALDLCYVACGVYEGFWEFHLNPWDVAAGSLIVQEAGGRVTGFSGEPLDLESGDTVASNGFLHEQLLAALGE